MKSYNEMTYPELLEEEQRIKELICFYKKGDMIAQKQYRKQLVRIQKMLIEYETFRFGKAITKYGI